MSQEIRIGLLDRRRAMPYSYPAPRVRVRVTPFTPTVDRDRRAVSDRAVSDDDGDDLRAARGILTATMLCLAFWIVIALIAWLIAR